MNNYCIITDSGSDLTKELAQKIDVTVLDLTVLVEGKEPQKDSSVDLKEFYSELRAQKGATTSALNIDDFSSAFEAVLSEGKDILYLGFSTGLSSTYSAGKVSAEEMAEKYPERKIYTVDTLAASMGQGLLVWYAANMQKEGKSIEEVRDFVEDNKLKLAHWFTVDDLMYLKRGGRISPTVAFVGNVLGIKPVLHMDNEGHLINMTKVRGRRTAVQALAQKYDELALDTKSGTLFISHGDCLADAEYLASIIKEKHGVGVEIITDVGPV